MHKKYNIKHFVSILFFLFFSALAASSADIVWIGSQNNNWNNSSNWSPSRIPSAGDNVYINGNASINIKDNVEISSLFISGDVILSGRGIINIYKDLVVEGSLVSKPALKLLTPRNSISSVKLNELKGDLIIDGEGKIELAGDVVLAGRLTIISGEFNTESFNIVADQIFISPQKHTVILLNESLVETNNWVVNSTDKLEFYPGDSHLYVKKTKGNKFLFDKLKYNSLSHKGTKASFSTDCSSTDASCHGVCDGTITVDLASGTPNYPVTIRLYYPSDLGGGYVDYNNVNNLPYTITGLCGSSQPYTVKVTDSDGDAAWCNVYVLEPGEMIVADDDVQDVSCFGKCDGSVQINYIQNAHYPVSYLWSNGDTTDKADSLCADSVYVTVTDDNGCQKVFGYLITQPDSFYSDMSVTNPTCNGACDGEATVTPHGGTEPYSYSWSNGATDSTISNLCAGQYIVTITDANSCEIYDTANVVDPPALSVAMSGNDPSCNGYCDGDATATPSGGTSPYSYSWDNGGTTQTISNLCAGTYHVTVTDANGCTAIDSITLNDPPGMTLTMSGNDVSCNGACDGDASVSVSGGATPYTYSWSNGATTQSINNLCADTYYVTVTDNNGCQKVDSITINEPAAITTSITKTDPSCNGSCDGDATVNVSGGTSPYSYSWSNGATTQTINNLCAGTYIVTVTDANGCTAQDTVELVDPAPVTVSITSDNPSCNGSCDGDATANPGGGTSPYSYSWSNGATTQTISNLCAGTYAVTVTDANGCTATASVTLTDPPALTVDFDSTNASCNGACDGSATANVSGGTSPYSYSWSNGETTQTINNLCAGTYTVTVTDANSCQVVDSVTITEPPAISISFSANDVSCNGACDGSATANVSGGTSPYSYSWSNGATTQTINNLCAGTYDLTVTDANGCTETGSVTINEPAALSSSVTTNDPQCNGGCDGDATVTVTGGTSPYSYSWSNGATTQTANNLCAGTYTVTVTDANGCSITDTAVINDPPGMTLSMSKTDVTCNGACDGTASVSVTGGTSPYSYSWDNGSTNSSADNLCAGWHYVTVTDANNCSKTDSIEINEPPALNAYISSYSEPSCYGTCDGSITANANGGTIPYSYAWSNGATTQTASNLCAGTYTVTVTDANGCTDQASLTLNQPDSISVSLNVTDVVCNGNCDGSIDATVSGGTSPYSYSWSNGATTEDINNLCAGTYTITVTDANSCQKTLSATVDEPDALQDSTSTVDVSCNGACDGSATVYPYGGTSPYSYSWSNGATTQTVNNLCAGDYIVTVTDANGCTITDTVTINEPDAIALNAGKQDASCNGVCDGMAYVSASNGTPPYSYSWSNGGTTDTITGLCAGTYSVTVTDANGCTATASVTVDEPTALNAYISAFDHPTCPGDCDGDITVSANGGTLPYSYAWSNGSTNQTVNNLCAGTYTATVTDANGCTDVVTFDLQDPPAINTTITTTDATCNGVCDGDVDLGVSGGVAPYSYSWNNGATSEDLHNVCAGHYVVTVTDANGCSAIDSGDVAEPPLLTADLTINSQPTCNGICDGDVTVSANGGTPGYSYIWNNGVTTANNNTLCAGTVSVTVTDANGCQITKDTTLVAPQVITISPDTLIEPLCNNSCDGIISITASGGTQPYTYNWSNSETTDSISNLCADTFIVTVTDANGCFETDTFVLNAPAPLEDSITTVSPLCYGDCNGEIQMQVSGGTPSYTINWSTGDNTDTITGLCAGTYYVTITDANNCQITDTVQLTQPDTLTGIFSAVEPACFGECNGSISVNVAGGTPAYSYLWNDGSTSQSLSNICAGTFSVTITDNNGCQITKDTTIAQPDSISIQFNNVSAVTCFGECDGSASITVTGGTSPYNIQWSNGDTGNSADSLCSGFVYVTVTDANMCSKTDSVLIDSPDSFYIDIDTVTEAYCGQCVAYIIVSAHGGTPGYSYLWNTGATTDSIGGLCPDIYSVTVTDANGCEINTQVTVVDTSDMNLSLNVTDITCNGFCDGSIDAVVSGGTPPYTYTWNTGDVTPSIDSLCEGLYSVTVTDVNNCMRVAQDSVHQTDELADSTDIQNILCYGECNGSIVLHPYGGTPPYNAVWENGSTDTVLNSLCAGYYAYTITDANGCSKIDSIEIVQPLQLTDTIFQTDTILCFGYNTGAAVIQVSGGTAPYSYLWSNGQTGDTLSNVTGGWYYVTVTDANGCQMYDSIEILQPDSVNIDFTDVSIIPCAGICTGHAQVAVNGGTSPYIYNWSNGDTGITADSLCGGYVYLTVTDANGCVYVDSVMITDTSNLAIHIDSMATPTCYGDCDAMVQVEATGGYPPYTYQWDANAGGQTGNIANNLCAGSYTITVTDDSGCYRVDTINVANPVPVTISLDTSNTSNLITCYMECNGSIAVSVSGGTSPYSYNWSHNGALDTSYVDSLCAGDYSLTVTDVNGCTATFDTTVISNGEIILSFDVTNPLCEYGSNDGNIIVTPSGGSGNYTYVWSTGSTADTLMNLGGGVYYVTVTDSIGCSKNDSVFLNPQILVVARADTDTTICPGDTVMIYGYTNGERFLWSPTTNMIDSTSLTPLVFPADTTVFYFTAFDSICYNWDSVTISVYPPMNIDAGEDVSIMKDQSTQLSVTGGFSGCTYHWVPSDGLSNDTISNPVAAPEQTTIYYVIVTDEHGCTAIDSVKVTVIPQLVIPNGITPNGDGINDVWVIDNIEQFPNVEIEIYNRWGEQIFYSKGYPPSERWDGTYKGKKLPTGTYYYVIKLHDPQVKDPEPGPITIVY